MRNEFISTIIPAYNEEARIFKTLELIHNYMKSSFQKFEILVVNDGSTDGTSEILDVFSRRFPEIRAMKNESNRGKGASVRRGMLSAEGSLLLISDADLSTPIEETEKLLPFIDEGYDIVIGSRGLTGSDIQVKQPWYRQQMGKTFNLLVRAFLMEGIRDTQCGFKLFKKNVAQRLFRMSLISGFSFDAEILFLAKKLGYRIKEEPVRWLNSPASKVNIVSDSTRMFLDLLKIRKNWNRGLYNKL